jgi:hypothetical protein
MTAAAIVLFILAILLVGFGLVLAKRARTGPQSTLASLLVALGILIAFVGAAFARDIDGRHAASPLKPWFDGLRSGKGPCCSDADGYALSDVDWESRAGGYRVRIPRWRFEPSAPRRRRLPGPRWSGSMSKLRPSSPSRTGRAAPWCGRSGATRGRASAASCRAR